MAYTIPNLSTTGGIEVVGAEIARQVPFFWSGILFLIYMVGLGLTYMEQHFRTGAGNMAQSAAISGLITATAGFILFMYEFPNGLIGIETLVIAVIVAIIGAFAFLLSDRQ